jgi:hypothetical protein
MSPQTPDSDAMIVNNGQRTSHFVISGHTEQSHGYQAGYMRASAKSSSNVIMT